MSLIGHYLYYWKFRLSLLLLLTCLLFALPHIYKIVQQYNLKPISLQLSLPLPADFAARHQLAVNPDIEKVFVSGHFSDWRADDSFYQLQQLDATHWQYLLAAKPGDTEYRFVVYLKNQPQPIWLDDPTNPEYKTNPFGQRNSLVQRLDINRAYTVASLLLYGLTLSFLLYCLAEPLLHWLLQLAMPFHRKLAMSCALMVVMAQLVLLLYQFHEHRQLIKQGIVDNVHMLHLALMQQTRTQHPPSEQALAQALQSFLEPATVRVEKYTASLEQITISDVALLDAQGRIRSLHHRGQNRNIQQFRATELGFSSTEQYFVDGVWQPLLYSLAHQPEHSIRFAPKATNVTVIDTPETRLAELMLGFSNVLVPIVHNQQVSGYYIAAIQVKLFGQELLRIAMMNLLLMLCILALAMALLLRIGRHITTHLQQLTQWTRAIVQGNFDSQLTISSNDEIQTLAEHFEQMRQSLQNSFNHIGAQKAELYHIAFEDSLTGLANRKRLLADTKSVVPGSMLLVNIDDFGSLNDFYGTVSADKVLCDVASTLTAHCKLLDARLYRPGADEFVITFNMECTDAIAENIISLLMQRPLQVSENDYYLSVTLGLVQREQAQNSNRDMLSLADIARRWAKKQSQRYAMFKPEMANAEEFCHNLLVLRQLKQAIDSDNIVPYVQRIEPLTAAGSVKYECLMRLITDEGAVLAPGYFMQVAKKSQLYARLTAAMLQKSMQLFEHSSAEFSVNLSMDDIEDANTVNYLLQLLQHYPHVAKRLTFELLETAEVSNYQAVSAFIRQVKLHGCKIAVDDFGSGYSNFVHVLSLDIDYLKIDGSLIRQIHTDSTSQHLLAAITGLASKMHIKTIAEFVESADILRTVRQFGIDYAQGYHIAKPQPFDDKTELN